MILSGIHTLVIHGESDPKVNLTPPCTRTNGACHHLGDRLDFTKLHLLKF